MSNSASAAPRFTEVEASVPDLDALSLIAADICSRIGAASTAAECEQCLREWDLVRCEVGPYDSLVSLRFHQDTANTKSKTEQDEWDAASPRWIELEVNVKRALLGHPLRKELELAIGAQAFALWESDALAFDEVIKFKPPGQGSAYEAM